MTRYYTKGYGRRKEVGPDDPELVKRIRGTSDSDLRPPYDSHILHIMANKWAWADSRAEDLRLKWTVLPDGNISFHDDAGQLESVQQYLGGGFSLLVKP